MTQMPTPKVEDTRSSVLTAPGVEQISQDTHLLNQYEPFTPILDRLLVKRIEDAPQGKMGLPDKFRQQTNKGEIQSNGVGELVKSNLNAGDRVLFGEYNAERFMKDGEELWLVREADIRGVERLMRRRAKLAAREEPPLFQKIRYPLIVIPEVKTRWYIRLYRFFGGKHVA